VEDSSGVRGLLVDELDEVVDVAGVDLADHEDSQMLDQVVGQLLRVKHSLLEKNSLTRETVKRLGQVEDSSGGGNFSGNFL
jgi:hypothetical protein